MTTLVIAEHDNASLKGATLNAVAAAQAIGGDVHVLVAGNNAGAAAQAAAAVAGVAKVLHADGAALGEGLAENLTAQVLAVAGNYSHIVFPATSNGKNVAPRVAAKLDVAQITDVTKVVAADTFERPIYAGSAIATVQTADAVKVLTVRTTAFDPAAATGGAAAVETPAPARLLRSDGGRRALERARLPPGLHGSPVYHHDPQRFQCLVQSGPTAHWPTQKLRYDSQTGTQHGDQGSSRAEYRAYPFGAGFSLRVY